MEMPDVQVIEFDVKDVIVTSGPNGGSFGGELSDDAPERRSVFED